MREYISSIQKRVALYHSLPLATNIVLSSDQRIEEAAAFNKKISDAYDLHQPFVTMMGPIVNRFKENYKHLLESARTEGVEATSDYIFNHRKQLLDGIDFSQMKRPHVGYGIEICRLFDSLLNNDKVNWILSADILRMIVEMDLYQILAIDNTHRAMVLIGGAGSGKTLTLVAWVRQLINSGISAVKILCLSFSDDASKVLKDRLSRINHNVQVRTLHSFALSMISQHRDAFPEIKGALDVLDEMMQEKMLRDVIDRVCPSARVDDIIKLLNRATHLAIFPTELEDMTIPERRIVEEYAHMKKAKSCIDFNDMVVMFVKKLSSDKAFRTAVGDKFEAIALDEVQDTSDSLLCAIALIRTNHRFIAVGDPSQRIYSFAGVSENPYQTIIGQIRIELCVLPYNHRSLSPIPAITDKFIRNNPREIVRPVVATRQGNALIETFLHARQADERKWVFDKVTELIDKNDYDPDDIAILTRTNQQAQGLLKSFKSLESTWKSRYAMRLKTREPEAVKMAMGLYSLLGIWHKDEISIGTQGSIMLKNFLHSLLSDLPSCKELPEMLTSALPFPCIPAMELLSHLPSDADPLCRERLHLLQKIASANEHAFHLLPDNLKNLGFASSLNPVFFACVKNEMFRILGMYSKISKGGSFADFLTWLQRISASNMITISTVHRAKGREWPCVIVPSCVMNNWPHYYATKSRQVKDVDDEMRLFYVACTRAEDHLILSAYERGGRGPVPISPYFKQIETIVHNLSLTKDSE